ncbi:MAG TPA: IS200/IS605 family transposase [Candidatus Nanoarchaeia archaeon]|nr:IS200/IS605 family transposase [Candidatus Nanoarchaeia archaeon]
MFHACHKVYEIKYHLIFIVKYRKDLLIREDYQTALKNILSEISKRYFLTPETIGFDEDHVHILMQGAPRYAPSRIMQIVKSITARKLFEQFPEIKRELWGGEFWSDGGYIGTVGEGANADIIRKYIQKQGRPITQLRLDTFTAA